MVDVQEDYIQAERLYEEALQLFREAEPEPGYWTALGFEMLGQLASCRRNVEQAVARLEQSLLLRRHCLVATIRQALMGRQRLARIRHDCQRLRRTGTYAVFRWCRSGASSGI